MIQATSLDTSMRNLQHQERLESASSAVEIKPFYHTLQAPWQPKDQNNSNSLRRGSLEHLCKFFFKLAQ